MKSNLLNALILVMLCVFTLSACKDDLNSSIEEDAQELKILYQEIETLAGQFTCENAAEWKFVAIGAKGCGGPTAYIAYSSKIDETKFLEKVSDYTAMQKDFNTKWDVASDCMFVTAPKGVECNNGKPKFVY